MVAQRPEVLVGLDSTPSARAALGWAARYARQTKSVVLAINVVPPAELMSQARGRKAGYEPSEAREERRREALTELFDSVSPAPDWLLLFAEGDPADILARHSQHAELLVIGTREHVGLTRLLDGSVSHYCLSHSACPVVAVPAWSRDAVFADQSTPGTVPKPLYPARPESDAKGSARHERGQI